MRLNDLDLRKALNRLGGVYSPPRDMESAVAAWREVLQGLDGVELSNAVTEYLKTDTPYFPKPGKILSIARLHRRNTGAYRTGGSGKWKEGEGPCPTCGAELRELDPLEQVLIGVDEAGALYDTLAPAHADAPNRLGTLHDLDAHDRTRQPYNVTYGYRRAGR